MLENLTAIAWCGMGFCSGMLIEMFYNRSSYKKLCDYLNKCADYHSKKSTDSIKFINKHSKEIGNKIVEEYFNEYIQEQKAHSKNMSKFWENNKSFLQKIQDKFYTHSK